jgi:hypothetical protein
MSLWMLPILPWRFYFYGNALEQMHDSNENTGHAESLICISGSTWRTPGNKPYHQTSLFLRPFSFFISSPLSRDGAPKVTAEALPRSWRREDAEAASSTLIARDGAAPGTAQARRRWEKLQPQVVPHRCVASCSSVERCEGKC